MGKETNISWCDATWNIARGCTKVDADCKFCYMYRDSFDNKRYNPKNVVKTKTVFNLPLKLKEPSKIFTSSLTDVFHPECDSFRGEMWDIIRKCPQHTFQLLTKRPERILMCLPDFWDEIKDRCWLGTSVGSQAGMVRFNHLIRLRQFAKVLFLSLEPLHEEITFDEKISLIDWVIVGGESGNENGKYGYRPCKIEWMEKIASKCQEFGVAFFVKQMGTHLAKELKMSDRHGTKIEEFPPILQKRDFPKK